MAISPFLQHVATDLWTRYGDRLAELTIVLPTRRSRLYFAEHMAALIDRPVWQPSYVALDELMVNSVGLKQADTYSLLIELYHTYIKHKQTEESFDHFYFWGEAMLADFDVVDKYRVDARKLFRNLVDLKELEGDFSFLDEEQIRAIQSFWQSFDPDGGSSVQQSFVEIWSVLYPIYSEFRERLQAKGIAYEGLSARLLSEQLEQNKHEDTFKGTHVFIGLNALNECEKTLLRHLKKRKQALFYWDYDKYYLENEQQEAGLFVRQNLKEFPPEELSADFDLFAKPKNIEVLASTGEIMQAKLAPLLLNELSVLQKGKLSELTRTVIIPADERLLMPLLYALPEDEEVNVTMGYPLSQTPVFTLADLLIHLQRGSKSSSKGRAYFYHKDVQAVLNHPYVKRLAGDSGAAILSDIIRYNKVYVGDQLFSSNAFLQNIFRIATDYAGMTDYLTGIISHIAEVDLGDNVALRREYAYHFVSSVRKLKLAIGKGNMDIGLPVFFSLLRIALRKISVPFNGEPLSGIQVMGILETRALDFENVIVLSLNEGILPQPISSVSFIPYNLRKGFGIPTVEHHEAMYAYYFYRILQRAKNVRLLYSTKGDNGSLGEPSRYLHQLRMESGHDIKERMLTYSIAVDAQHSIQVEKTADLMEKLDVRAEGGLSPSAVSCYISCPLQFYFKYLAGLKELDEVEEEVGMASFGNILHRTVEKLYKPYIGRTIDKASIQQMLKNVDELRALVNQAFAEVYYMASKLPDDFEQNGRLAIVRDVVIRYVSGVLQYDAAKAPFELRMLEDELNVLHTINVNGKEKEIHLKGILDRVDELDGCINIVDYKTGRSKQEFKGVDALFADSFEKQNSAVFQTFLYALMYEKQNGTDKTVMPTLYFVRDVYATNFNPKVLERAPRAEIREVTDFSFYRDEFTRLLNESLGSLFDVQKPFTQTTDAQICKSRCPFRIMCNR